jgi:hypothetical protein
MFRERADVFHQYEQQYESNMAKIRSNTYAIQPIGYFPDALESTDETTADIRKRDIQQLMDQENIMYYTGMIAACSLFVAAFVLVAKRG